MRIDVITLFARSVDQALSESIVGRARSEGFLRLGFLNPRDFSGDRRGTVDDKPYGGGTGMVLMAEPVYQALKKARKKGSFAVLLTPKGRPFTQKLALRLAKKKHLIFICGHYEGADERISPLADLELSIGDYVLTGGEPAASVVIDAIARLIPGVLKKTDATVNETFTGSLLEAPHYTRPAIWRGKKVPAVLLGGNHALIEDWRHTKALELTKKYRPDLMKRLQEEV